jgi:hypothetical protein
MRRGTRVRRSSPAADGPPAPPPFNRHPPQARSPVMLRWLLMLLPSLLLMLLPSLLLPRMPLLMLLPSLLLPRMLLLLLLLLLMLRPLLPLNAAAAAAAVGCCGRRCTGLLPSGLHEEAADGVADVQLHGLVP